MSIDRPGIFDYDDFEVRQSRIVDHRGNPYNLIYPKPQKIGFILKPSMKDKPHVDQSENSGIVGNK